MISWGCGVLGGVLPNQIIEGSVGRSSYGGPRCAHLESGLRKVSRAHEFIIEDITIERATSNSAAAT